MKKLLTTALVGMTTLSLAGCGIRNQKTTTTKSTTSQVHRKYYFDGKTANLHDEKIKITKISFYSADENTADKNLIVFDYDITNKTNKDIDAISGWNVAFKAYQDNKNTEGRLKVGGLPEDTSQQVLNDQDQTIKKGGTVHSRAAYKLDSNEKPVVLKCFKGTDGRFLGQKKFKIGKFKDDESTVSQNQNVENISKTGKQSAATNQNGNINSKKHTSGNDKAAYEKSLRSIDPGYWDALSPQEKNTYLNDSNPEDYSNSAGLVSYEFNKMGVPLPDQSSGN